MIVVDLVMKPVDSFWKKQFHGEEIRRNRAEADLSYYRQISEQQEKDLALLSKRDYGQSRAIEAMNREIARLNAELDKAGTMLEAKDDRIRLLTEALQAEREARAALKTAQRLWDEKKERITTPPKEEA